MPSKYTRQGDTWFLATEVNLPVFEDLLPVGNYNLRHHPMMGYHFVEAKPFKVGKIYGDVHKRVDRILNTYVTRSKNTGVLAVGEKGSGKTLLTQLLSIEAAENYNIPTIIIDGNPHGEGFNNFLAKIDSRALILFDEFEKYYDEKAQSELLTIFDGVYQSNKLFMFTANNEYKIDRSMISRPGRIYYRFNYKYLDEYFIREYCEDNLYNKDEINNIINVIDAYGDFTFDKLKALVEEVNRYKEKPSLAIRYLNINFSDYRVNNYYDLEVFKESKLFYEAKAAVSFNPFSGQRLVYIEPESNDDDDEDRSHNDTSHKRKCVTLSPDKIDSVTNGQKTITYKVDGYKVVLSLPKTKEYNYPDR